MAASGLHASASKWAAPLSFKSTEWKTLNTSMQQSDERRRYSHRQRDPERIRLVHQQWHRHVQTAKWLHRELETLKMLHRWISRDLSDAKWRSAPVHTATVNDILYVRFPVQRRDKSVLTTWTMPWDPTSASVQPPPTFSSLTRTQKGIGSSTVPTLNRLHLARDAVQMLTLGIASKEPPCLHRSCLIYGVIFRMLTPCLYWRGASYSRGDRRFTTRN